MNRTMILLAGAVGACAIAVPTVLGLSGNPSFSQRIAVPVPSDAAVVTFGTDGQVVASSSATPPATAASPRGPSATTRSRSTEPGDDRGARTEPGDDRGARTEPGDDNGARTEPGDDNGARTEPGDDNGGRATLTRTSGPRSSSSTEDNGHGGRHGVDG